MSHDALMPASTEITNRQRLFMRYFTATLVDLVILNLFVEYTTYVQVDGFTISLLAAVVLQVLLKVTIAIEHKVGAYFKAKPGGWMVFWRYTTAWLVLFGSKFVILEVLALFFGDKLKFGGPWHGILVLIGVVIVMLVVEEVIVRIYRKLGDPAD